MSFNTKTIQEILKDYSKEKGNLMIVLQKIQKSCGNYLPKEAVLEVAKVTKMPLNKLYAFISFYSMFSTKKEENILFVFVKTDLVLIMGEEKL